MRFTISGGSLARSTDAPVAMGGDRVADDRGSLIIDVVLGLIILALVLNRLLALEFSQQETNDAVVAGQLQATHEQAIRAVFRGQQAVYLSQAATTGPVAITATTIAGYLPPGTATTNAFGQGFCGVVKIYPGNKLALFTVAYGGTPLTDGQASDVALGIGGDGGYNGRDNPGNFDGLSGWSIPVGDINAPGCTASAGHVVAYDQAVSGLIASPFLSRVNTGNALDNTMNTALLMSGCDNPATTGVVETNFPCNMEGAGDVGAATLTLGGTQLNGTDAQVLHSLTSGFYPTIANGGNLTIASNLTVNGSTTSQGPLVVNSSGTFSGQIVVPDINLTSIGHYASQGVYMQAIVPVRGTVAKPVCPTGETAQIFSSPVLLSDNGAGRPLLAYQAPVTDLGSSWMPRLIVFTQNATGSGSMAVEVVQPYGALAVSVKCS